MRKKLLSMILLLTAGFLGCAAQDEDIEEDGGIKAPDFGNDAPKTIESTEITSFSCEISLVSMVLEEESELDGRIYNLDAILENGVVNCKIAWRDRYGGGETKEFSETVDFLEKLQEIVAEYDFARHNGYVCRESGLPDTYGSMLNIKYASGESIYAYDNQSAFISFEAVRRLTGLFDPKIDN